MTSSSFLNGIQRWQIFVLISVVLTAAIGSYLIYAFVFDGTSDLLEDDQRLIPIQLGDLINKVSVNGSLSYTNRELLSFGVQGTVGKVHVKESDRVVAGQIIAILDTETIRNLERAVAQARINLRDAEIVLQSSRTPYTASDLDKARSEFAKAATGKRTAQRNLNGQKEDDLKSVTDAQKIALELELALRISQKSLNNIKISHQYALSSAKSVLATRGKDLQDSEKVLGELSHTEKQLEQLAYSVSQAYLNLDESLTELEELRNPSMFLLDQKQNKRDFAEITMMIAKESLDVFRTPSQDQIIKVEVQITDAKLALKEAKEALILVRNGPDEDSLNTANADAELARMSLKESELDVKLAQLNWNNKLDEASKTLNEAVEAYQSVFTTWLGATLSTGDLLKPPVEILENWALDLSKTFDPGTRYFDLSALMLTREISDLPETPWDETVIYFWINFFPGKIVPVCDIGDTTFQGFCVIQELESAWDSLVIAREALAKLGIESDKDISKKIGSVTKSLESKNAKEKVFIDLQEPSTSLEIEKAHQKIELLTVAVEDAERALALLLSPSGNELNKLVNQYKQAEINFHESQADLDTYISGPSDLELQNAERKATLMEASLAVAISELEAAKQGPTVVDVKSANSQISLAKNNLLLAQADLDHLQSGVHDLEIGLAQKQYELAKVNLDIARIDLEDVIKLTKRDNFSKEADLKRLDLAIVDLEIAKDTLEQILRGPNDLDIALRQADVSSASASLDVALQKLESAVIKAPFSGMIITVNIEDGQVVNRGYQSVEIVDSSVVQVDGTIDEIDVLFISEGSDASITMDALQGQTLSGTVINIAPQGVSQQGVVTYPITVGVEVPSTLELPEGLSAVASVVIREDLGVLLVPVDALFGSFEKPILKVMSEEVLTDRDVSIGNSDDFWVVIESGASEGELVLLETRQASTQGFGFGRSFNPVRGGFTGGGFGSGGRGSSQRAR